MAGNSQAGRQATPAPRSSSQAAGNPQIGRQIVSPISRTTLLPRKPLLSSPTLYPAGRLPPADSTLPQAESVASQSSNPQVIPAVRCSARLRVLQASQADSTILQSDSNVSQVSASQNISSQAGSTPLADSAISQSDSVVSQAGTSHTGNTWVRCSARLSASLADSAISQADSKVSWDNGSQATSSASSQEARASFHPTTGITIPRVLLWSNLTLIGLSTYLVNL